MANNNLSSASSSTPSTAPSTTPAPSSSPSPTQRESWVGQDGYDNNPEL